MFYVRVRDNDTKHQFDVPEGDKRIGVSLTLLNRKEYPPSVAIRRPKHHTKLAGRSASREVESAPAGSAEAPKKENTDG